MPERSHIPEQYSIQESERKSLRKKSWVRSRLLAGALAGLVTFMHSDSHHSSYEEQEVAEKSILEFPKLYPEKKVPEKAIFQKEDHSYAEDAAAADRERRESVSFFKANAELNKVSLQKLVKRYDDIIYSTVFSGGIAEDLEGVFYIKGWPKEITNEEDFRTVLDKAQVLMETFSKDVAFDGAYRIVWEAAISYFKTKTAAVDGGITTTIRDQDDFLFFGKHWEGSAYYPKDIYHFNLDNIFPPVLSPQDLPGLVSKIEDYCRASNIQCEFIEQTMLIPSYLERVRFSEQDFPSAMTPDNEEKIAELVRSLNAVQIHVDGKVVGLRLGERYLAKLAFTGYSEINIENPQDLVKIFKRMKIFDEEQNLYHQPFRASFAKNIPINGIPSEFTAENFEKVADFYIAVVEANNGFILPSQEALFILGERLGLNLRRSLYGDKVTSEGFPVVYRKLKEVIKNIGAKELAYPDRIAAPLLFPAEMMYSLRNDRLPVYPDKHGDALTIDELDEKTITAMSSRNVFEAHGLPDTISPTTLPIFKRMADSALEAGTDHYFFNKVKAHLSPEWGRPTTWSDIQRLDAMLEDQPAMLQSVIAAQVVLDDFPTFSLYYKTLHKLPMKNTTLRRSILTKGELKDVPFKVSLDSLSEIVEQYKVLDKLDTMAGDRYLEMLDFSGFPRVITDQTIAEVAAALTVLENSLSKEAAQKYATYMSGSPGDKSFSFAPIITNENLETETAKFKLEQYNLITLKFGQPVEFKINFPPAKNFDELVSALTRLSWLQRIDAPRAKEFIKKVFEEFDWKKIFESVDLTDVEKMERIRTTINQMVNSTYGDRLIVEIGSKYVERVAVTWDTLEKKVSFCESYMQLDGYRIEQDVRGMYVLVGNFQAAQILEFFDRESVDLSGGRVEQIIRRLEAIDIVVPRKDGFFARAWRNIGNPAHLMKKGMDYAASSAVLRPEFARASFEIKGDIETMSDGYVWQSISDGTNSQADIIIGQPDKGARIDYMVKVGGGLTEQLVDKNYPPGSVVAEAVGAYTTGALKPAELTIRKGEVVNYLLSNREGLVLVSAAGEIKIIHRDLLKENDIKTSESAAILPFRKNLASFERMLKLFEDTKGSLMAGHLLVVDGTSAVAGNSSGARDKRRVIVTFLDGRFGLVDFKDSVTLYEAAYILEKIGVQGAVNLDTGYYDHANVYTKDGQKIELGEQDKDGTNNKFIFLKATKAK